MWVHQRAIKLSHRASEIMYETMAVSLFTRNGVLKTRYFAARKLTYRTRSLIYAKDCKDLFLSPTLIIVIAWVQTPPPPPPRSLSPPIFAEGRLSVHRRHCYTYYQDLLRKRELKHYITITLTCVLKRKRTKTIFLKILFFFFHRVTWSILSCFMATMETSIFTLVQSNILYLLPIL